MAISKIKINNVEHELQTTIDNVVDLQDALDGKATKNHGIYYGTCDDDAATVGKTVVLTDETGFSLTPGTVIAVKFKNTNSASNPTLNVNGTGARKIYRYGTTASSTSASTSGWRAGAVQIFIYDDTGWVRDFWENSTYSNVSLGQGYATCDTAAATTAKVGALTSYKLSTGGIVSVKFDNSVPANATLNINSTGAKNIYYKGTKITAGIIESGDLATFIYNGSYYHLIAIDRWQKDIEELRNSIPTNLDLGHCYVNCTNTSITTELVAEKQGYKLNAGGIVVVTFLNSVPANATLKINDLTAVPIKYNGRNLVGGVIGGADTVTFMYDGSCYHLLSIDRWQQNIVDIQSEINSMQYTLNLKAYKSTKINGYTLDSDITLTASDVDAYSKAQIDSLELITVDDIDSICGMTIQDATRNGVTF